MQDFLDNNGDNNTLIHKDGPEDRKHKKGSHKNSKRMPIWLLVLTDILLAAASLGIFLLYFIVLPQKLSSENIILATAEDTGENTFALPDNSSDNDSTDIDSSADSSRGNGREVRRGNYTNYKNTNTDYISADASESLSFSKKEKTITQVNHYRSDNIQMTTNKVEVDSGKDKITYYVSDIYVTNVKYIKTAFAEGEYGKNFSEPLPDLASNNNAIVAINGDFYGRSEESVVIRNGVLYRSDVDDVDICVLFTDGTMKTYSPEEFNADELIQQGVWQAWTFGPSLLDGQGNILSSFNTTDYIYTEHPRTCIGYVEPGHYVFVVVDGRSPGYSRGASLNELAQIMVDAGCVTAYNLDGGGSSAMVYGSEYVNYPSKGGRDVSDIIYVGE